MFSRTLVETVLVLLALGTAACHIVGLGIISGIPNCQQSGANLVGEVIHETTTRLLSLGLIGGLGVIVALASTGEVLDEIHD